MAKKVKPGLPVEMPTGLFLKKEMVEATEKAVVYELAEEFSATRRNRGYKVYLRLAVFSALLLAGTFGTTSYIERQNRNVEIGISDFEDINMQELLYSLRNAGKLLADMRETMSRERGQMAREQQRIRAQALADLEALKKQHDLSDAERAAMMKKILEERDKKMASVNDDYNSRLKEKEQSIASIKSKMGENQAELQRKMNIYVGRMESRLKEYQKESSESKAKAQQLVREVSVSAALKQYEEKRENEKKLKELADKMKRLEEDLKNSRLRTEELDALLISYRKAMRHYASIRGEGGHVVCVQRDGSLLVELSPTLEQEKFTRGLVVDKSGALIARIDITLKDGLKKAHVVSRLKNVPISPFDIIIVQKK